MTRYTGWALAHPVYLTLCLFFDKVSISSSLTELETVVSNDFIWPEELYQQDINPIDQYIRQAATFLQIQRGLSEKEAVASVIEILRDKNACDFRDPEVVYYERDDNWVKQLKTGTLSGYLRSAKENKEVITPTMTTYVSPRIEKSLISVFMKRNATSRALLKKRAQEEEMRKNDALAYQLNNDQDNAKRNNNSMSGVMAAVASIFENPTGHNTLTSITRSMSSISNALNERMIGGNRHYHDSDTIINEMTVIANTMNTEAVHEAIRHYGLTIPSHEDIRRVIKRSSDKYWRDERHIQFAVDYAEKMSPEQRAAFVYTQDLYHLRLLNPGFMKDLIDEFSMYDESLSDIEDPVGYLKKADPLITNYAHQVFISLLRGAEKDRSQWKPEVVQKVARACRAIENACRKYKLLFKAFLVVKTVPCSTAYISHMSRESVVLSDTDSTMFSVDDWVIWYFGKLVFNDRAFAVAGSIMFISTQLISHAMAILSANMNVDREQLFVLSMKPEFVFPVFAQTPVAKHYFCSMSVKEGGVYDKNKYEIKGVHLKSSASPVQIISAAHERMKYILDLIEAGEEIDLRQELDRVADLERTIINSLKAGEPTYLKKMFIKTIKSYANGPEESPYRHHILWNEVFGHSYSYVDEPPYVALKIPLTTTSKRKTQEWLISISDKGLADRFQEYLKKREKTEIKTFYISQDYVQAYGMPIEILKVMDFKRVALDLTVTDRMILETIGYRPKLETLLIDQGY